MIELLSMESAVSAAVRRRRELLSRLPGDALLVLPAAEPSPRAGDTFHPFRQHSDFLYLSAFEAPAAVLVLAPAASGGKGESILFCRPRDAARERWEGPEPGTEGAVADYGFDRAFPLSELELRMPRLMRGRGLVYAPLNAPRAFAERLRCWRGVLLAAARDGVEAPAGVMDSAALLHEMRLIKDAWELRAMRLAGEISAVAHCQLMRCCRPGLSEYQLEAEFRYACAMRGARHLAYDSIVAAGANACVLHYTANDQRIEAGQLVLVDAGCEVAGYAADITRTFPADGRFSAEQRALHDLVALAWRAALAAVAPGRGWHEPHEAAVRALCRGLVDLGLLEGEVDGLIESGAYQRFYMHRTGHWLGLNVHDVGAYKVAGHWRELCAGMAFTIEPGLYIDAGDETVAARWRGIGVRIEDDVLVTEQGAEILNGEVPRTAQAIEDFMAAARQSPSVGDA